MPIQNTFVPALERALNIIEYLSNCTNGVTLKQISHHLDIPAASAFRLIKNLVNRGYVTEITNGQTTYILGNQIMKIASSAKRNSSLTSTAKPIMQQLANQLKQTVQLAIWQNGSLFYIEQAFSTAPLSVIAPLYEPVAINTSASAKIILSYLPEDERTLAISQCAFEKLTPNTITEPTKFIDEIKKSNVQGFGLDSEEFSLGIGCLSVPIFDSKNLCISALGITGPIQTYQNNFSEMLSCLLDASKKISNALIL